MKKIGIIAGVFLILIIAGIYFINEKEGETEVTLKTTKVGVIMNGSKEDGSWGQSHYEGIESCSMELNLEVIYKENVLNDDTCADVIHKLIDSGCEIIIFNSISFGDWVVKAAEEHPDIYFFHATGVEERKNLATYFGRIYQVRYLSGIVAGLQTKTNEIGYVAAYPISEVNRGINAFTLGVRSVNEDAVVHVKWCNTWNDDELTENVTRELLEKHNIDVITMHTDSLKPLEVADEKGVWSIGYNMDNRETFPDTFLTAAVWNWEAYYEPRILECLQGKFQGKHYWEGIETGVVSLSPFTSNVSKGIEEIIEKEQERFYGGMFDVFYGPIKDMDGVIRIDAGESMSDYSMLNEFDWYVEGVVFDEED